MNFHDSDIPSSPTIPKMYLDRLVLERYPTTSTYLTAVVAGSMITGSCRKYVRLLQMLPQPNGEEYDFRLTIFG
jgi:hypothetical protein